MLRITVDYNLPVWSKSYSSCHIICSHHLQSQEPVELHTTSKSRFTYHPMLSLLLNKLRWVFVVEEKCVGTKPFYGSFEFGMNFGLFRDLRTPES